MLRWRSGSSASGRPAQKKRQEILPPPLGWTRPIFGIVPIHRDRCQRLGQQRVACGVVEHHARRLTFGRSACYPYGNGQSRLLFGQVCQCGHHVVIFIWFGPQHIIFRKERSKIFFIHLSEQFGCQSHAGGVADDGIDSALRTECRLPRIYVVDHLRGCKYGLARYATAHR